MERGIQDRHLGSEAGTGDSFKKPDRVLPTMKLSRSEAAVSFRVTGAGGRPTAS